MSTPSAAKSAVALCQHDLDSFDYDQLRTAIEQIVPLVEQQVTIAGTDLRWHKVADPDRLLSEAAERPDLHSTDIDPFWAVAWRAAEGLDKYLQRVALDEMQVLELGSGAGHAGIAAALRGARVTITDAVELALLVARLNSWPVRSRVTIGRLCWSDDSTALPKFPLIIGSDLVYDPSHFAQLEQCARRHLAPRGALLLSEPQRHTGDYFASWIIQAGWTCTAHLLDLGDGRIPIRVFECQLGQRSAT